MTAPVILNEVKDLGLTPPVFEAAAFSCYRFWQRLL